MSFKYMALASEKTTGSPTKKLILLLLADRSNDFGKCYPSLDTISKDCELSKSAVIRNIKELEKMGFLEIIHRTKDGSKLSNIYVLHLEGVVAQKHKGSSSKLHKPINEPIKPAIKDMSGFIRLWKDYTLTFLKGQNRKGGSKAKALKGYTSLAELYTDEQIYNFVEDHASQKIGHKDLERLLRVENIKQYLEDL